MMLAAAFRIAAALGLAVAAGTVGGTVAIDGMRPTTDHAAAPMPGNDESGYPAADYESVRYAEDVSDPLLDKYESRLSEDQDLY